MQQMLTYVDGLADEGSGEVLRGEESDADALGVVDNERVDGPSPGSICDGQKKKTGATRLTVAQTAGGKIAKRRAQ